MDQKQMKSAGIACMVICVICLFVAVERYNTNANNVHAFNSTRQSTPLGGMFGQGDFKPATPAAAKYALFFALLSGAGGGVLLSRSGKPPRDAE